MANRYWVGGTASWDGTAGTKWSDVSGGAGGFSVPTSVDDVFLDAVSGTVTVTIAANTGAKSINCTGFTGTLASSSNFSLSGDFTASSTMTLNSIPLWFIGTSTVILAGKSLGNVIIYAPVTLGDAYSGGVLSLDGGGVLNTNNYNVSSVTLSTPGSAGVRTFNLGSSTITTQALYLTTSGTVVVNAGTSNIILTAGISDLQTNGATFYNVTFSSTAANTHPITGSNTFNNLTIAAPAAAGVRQVSFNAPTTINGTLSTTGTAGNRRVWFRGTTYGLAHTLTVNSAPSLTDADFRDIYVIGSAAPISGTRIGDLRGCNGITFSPSKTVYWNLVAGGNWSAGAWAASSGGSVSTDNFPLAQDTAIIENTGLNTSATVTFDGAVDFIGTLNMSSRTNAMTFSTTPYGPSFYGNLTFGSGVTATGTNGWVFRRRNTQTITSAGKTIPGSLTVDSYGGTVELADALNLGTSALNVTNGTFDTKNFSVTAGSLSSSNSNVREIILGSSTVTLTSTSPLTFTEAILLTFNAGTSNIICSGEGIVTLNLGNKSLQFYDLNCSGPTSSVVLVFGTNPQFRNLTFASPLFADRPIQLTCDFTVTGTLNISSNSVTKRVHLLSYDSFYGSLRTLTVNSLNATNSSFRDIKIIGAAENSAPLRAGNLGNNSGIVFPTPKTVYWNLAGAQNWSSNGWCTTSGGTPDVNNFPLPQDTAIFNNLGAAGTVTLDNNWFVGTVDMSARTNAMTYIHGLFGYNMVVLGDWKFGTGVTVGTSSATLSFSGTGNIQTLTSNGVQITFGIRVDAPDSRITDFPSVVLGDALSSTKILEVSEGSFDAVTYNVTCNNVYLIGNKDKILKMGSGTWTLIGTGTVFDIIGSNNTLYKGTANIVLSNTSTTARTFNGVGFSYNKLTIGGTTGTSTTTITGNNQFTELASTKTVAHTIALGTTVQTFGKWTVTGSLGNVVTLTGTGTGHILAGACTSGIDYLAMGSIAFSIGGNTSAGEFYAGANSTGTAIAPVYRTAKPADSIRYWVGGTGNWSDTAKWSTGSGGAGGASVPRSHDDVVFDSASNATAYTATINTVTGGIRMKSLTVAGPASGNLTLAGSTNIDGIHGNITLPATGLTRNYTGQITLSGSTVSKIFTTNGVLLASTIIINGVGCEWSLGSSLNTGTIVVTNGSFNLANFNLSTSQLSSNNNNSRTITLGSSTVTMGGTTPVDFGTTISQSVPLVFNAGTSQINISNASPTFNGNGNTFYNVGFTGTSAGSCTINGANSFNNVSFTGAANTGYRQIFLLQNQIVNGTLTFSAGTNATCRQFCRSNTFGTTRTITAAAVSMTDVDFRDITIAGAAAPASGTRIGDCKGNSGITFTAPKTVYWVLTSGGQWHQSWATTSGGLTDTNNFPLAQDIAIIENTGLNSGATITIADSWQIGTIDMSARTANTMTLATGTTSPTIYKNWINGTGTTLTGTGTISFAGRGAQLLTSAGKTFTQPFTIVTPGGSVTLQDAFTTSAGSGALNVSMGTFDAQIYNVTFTYFLSSVVSSNSNIRSINVGSGTWTIAGSSWDATTSTNLTVNGTGIINFAGGTFAGGGISYSGITLNKTGTTSVTITGNNIFKSITNTYAGSVATMISLGTSTQRVIDMSLPLSNPVGRLTINGTSGATPGNLIYIGSGIATDINSITLNNVRLYPTTNTWYVGKASTNNGSVGAIFDTTSLPQNSQFFNI